MEAWDKRGSESAHAFQAFAVYRDMGADRSIAKAAKLVGKKDRTLKTWSGLHDWVQRVHQYDLHLDREQQQLQIKERKAMLVRHATAALRLQEKALKAVAEIEPGDLTTSDIVRGSTLPPGSSAQLAVCPKKETRRKRRTRRSGTARRRHLHRWLASTAAPAPH